MQLGHKQAVVADHLEVDCGEQDDGGDGDDGDGNYVDGDDNDIHRSHTDASPEAAPETCHPLRFQFWKFSFCKQMASGLCFTILALTSFKIS